MISRLRPLDVAISFEERAYRLGELIDLTIELMPHRDCHVREGRIDLMVEERWKEQYTLSMEKPVIVQPPRGIGPPVQVGTETVTKDVNKDHKETSVHSSARFLENARLESGTPYQHSVRFEIQPEPPGHATDAKIKWWLQTVIDIASARDIKPRNRVSIAV